MTATKAARPSDRAASTGRVEMIAKVRRFIIAADEEWEMKIAELARLIRQDRQLPALVAGHLPDELGKVPNREEWMVYRQRNVEFSERSAAGAKSAGTQGYASESEK